MIQHNMEYILNLCDCLPSGAAAAHHCCQVWWSDQVSLQQVQADSSTEALQKATMSATCSLPNFHSLCHAFMQLPTSCDSPLWQTGQVGQMVDARTQDAFSRTR